MVRYPDGSEARIISGAGIASALGGRVVAIVGSALDNGDRMTEPLRNDSVIVQYAVEPRIEGLLDPSFMPSASQGGRYG